MPRSTEPTARARREPSGTLTRAFRAFVWAFALLVLGVDARAQPGSPVAEGVDPGATPREPRATTAKIVLVGAAAADPELPLLFVELLGRQGVSVELARAERFDPNELFDVDDGSAILVFVVLDPKRARLRFRGPNGERYLLRRVTLSGGLDAVGRELLGQVVESSVLALLRSDEGMSRTEVAEELERDDAPDAAPPRREPSTRAPTPATRLPPPSPWELRLGLRYAAVWSGVALGLSHGPGLAVGARFRRAASFGLELGADRRFAQSLSTPALTASIQRTAGHALLEAGLGLSRSQSAFAAIGGVLEWTRVLPRSRTAGVTPTRERTELSPSLRAELRYELGNRHLVVGVAALVEASFVRTRYELVQAGNVELLAAPAVLRPGGVVTVGVKP